MTEKWLCHLMQLGSHNTVSTESPKQVQLFPWSPLGSMIFLGMFCAISAGTNLSFTAGQTVGSFLIPRVGHLVVWLLITVPVQAVIIVSLGAGQEFQVSVVSLAYLGSRVDAVGLQARWLFALGSLFFSSILASTCRMPGQNLPLQCNNNHYLQIVRCPLGVSWHESPHS